MTTLATIQPADYVVLGHLTADETPQGRVLGGTAAYAALTARALGLRVGVVTAASGKLDYSALQGVQVLRVDSEQDTVFENHETPSGRRQWLRAAAAPLSWTHVPERWRRAPLLHLGPVAQELPPSLDEGLSPGFLGVTPQGWLRTWDETGAVRRADWPQAEALLAHAGAVVLSLEDVDGDEAFIDEMVLHTPVLAVTEGAEGVRLYWRGDVRRFWPPKVSAVDPTGAGDIFAAAFFIRLYTTRDPWEAARFATCLAACSVTRPGLAGIPSRDEVQKCLVEVL